MSRERLDINDLVAEAKGLLREQEIEWMESNVEELLALAEADHRFPYSTMKLYPRYVVWELTLACNMRCGHCGSTAGEARGDELSLDEMRRLCDQLGELECERLTLLGGEPLIHPHWEAVTARLQKAGVRVNVITNGWTLNDPRLCDRLARAGLSIVGISLDGLRESHDRLRRPGSFDRIMTGMDLLRERDIPLAVCTVITTDSIRDLDGLYDVIVDKGAAVWQLQIASPQGRLCRNDPLIIKPEQVRRIYDLLFEKRSRGDRLTIDLGDDIGYFVPCPEGFIRNTRRKGTQWLGCQAGIQVLGIDSNGDVKGCESLPSTAPFIEGNLRRRSLRDIWHDPEAFAYNRRFDPTVLAGGCATCRFGRLCKAGCTSSALAHSGSIGDNPMCVHRV